MRTAPETTSMRFRCVPHRCEAAAFRANHSQENVWPNNATVADGAGHSTAPRCCNTLAHHHARHIHAAQHSLAADRRQSGLMRARPREVGRGRGVRRSEIAALNETPTSSGVQLPDFLAGAPVFLHRVKRSGSAQVQREAAQAKHVTHGLSAHPTTGGRRSREDGDDDDTATEAAARFGRPIIGGESN